MMKTIRIDHKTLILVDSSVPDDVARKRYLDNIARTAYHVKNAGGYRRNHSKVEEEIPEPEDGIQEEEEDED